MADFDGDGAPEVAVAERETLILFDPDCGLDGAYEVVHRDDCALRIFDGRTGAVVCETPLNASAGRSGPVIADADGDGHAEIVVAAPAMTSCGMPEGAWDPAAPADAGLFVFSHPEDLWPATRPIWNQETFHGSNIADDGTVPYPVEPGEVWRGQASLPDAVAPPDICGELREVTRGPAPDLTVSGVKGIDDACLGADGEVRAVVHNRGAAAVPAGVLVRFFLDDEDEPGRFLCGAATESALSPGASEQVACVTAVVIVGPVWAIAAGPLPECATGNNRALLAGCEVPPP